MAAQSLAGIIRKPRNKVSRACENCRRRKIKCTGKQPCNNCVTYQCECVFTKNGNPLVSSAKLKSTSTDEFSSSISSETTVDSATGSERRKSNIYNGSKVSSDAIFDPVLDCVYDTKEDNEQNDDYKAIKEDKRDTNANNNGIHAPGETPRGSSPVPNVGSMAPLSVVKGDHGLYQEDIEFQQKVIDLQSALKKLSSIATGGAPVQEAIKSINDQVESLIEKWEPQYDSEKYDRTVKGGISDSKSLETHLMKNKYSGQVFLTCYSMWTDTGKTDKLNNAENQPLVDEFFGLYSPYQGVSLRGIGYFFQRCVSGVKSKEHDIQLKESLYLLLRFFDLCMHDLNQSCVSIANPLESYLKRRNLLGSVSNSVPNSVASTSPSVGTPSSTNNKDLILRLIDRLPQPFVENLTGVTNEMLYQTMYDDFSMFSLVLKMYECHRKGFESLMMKMTVYRDPDCPSHKPSPIDAQNFLHFCEEEELLLALCYNYYNSTMYHFDGFAGNLNYFELLLSLLETQRWLDEHYGFDKVLGIAISYAYRIGLSRWEYYVGLDEETAERRRKCWWKLYCLEKFFSFKKGQQSSIDDSTMNCLLSREFRELGFSDSNSLLSKVTAIPRSWAFDNMTIPALKFYGECALLHVVSRFYSEALFAERYTSIKNTAKPPFMKERLTNEIFQKIHDLKLKFDAIKNQTMKLFEIAMSSNNETLNMFVSKDEKSQAAHYALFHGSLYSTVLTSATNLIARLLVRPKNSSVTDHFGKYARTLRQIWREMTILVLSLEEAYTVSHVFDSYAVVCLRVVSGAYTTSSFAESSEELIMFLKVFKRLRNIPIFYENRKNESVASSKAYRIYVRFVTFMAINIHTMMLGYMRLHDMTKETLVETIENIAPDVAYLPSMLLNPKSVVFEPLMEPVETSGFHLKVRKMFERDIKDSKEKFFPKPAVPVMPQFHDQASPHSLTSMVAPTSTAENRSECPPYPTLPSIQSLADMHKSAGTPAMAGKVKSSGQQPGVKNLVPLEQDPVHHHLTAENSSPYKGYDLGTLDEFINNGDLNDLCNTLWSDLYATDMTRSIFSPHGFQGS